MHRPTDPGRGTEAGFSLMELVVVMAILSIVLLVLGQTLWHVQRTESYTRGRTEALDDMRAALTRMTKDLRQTSNINAATATHLDVDTYVDGAAATVVYDLSGGTLTRQVNGGSSATLVTEVTGATVFTYTPDATTANIVTIELVTTPSNLPETTLTLESEIELRNR